MANEAVLMWETELPIPFTVANGTGIEKGAVLTLSDPMTAAQSAAAGDLIAGICAEEKIASDGKTKIPVYRSGIFKVYLSGSCTVGDLSQTDASNNSFKVFDSGGTSLSGSKVAGIFLETGTTGQTVLMELNIGAVKSPQA